MKILIAGAGLGGLAAALCLKKSGHDVEIFEQAPVLGEIGAGIQLGGNAVRVLQYLGLRERLEEVVVRPDSIQYRLFNSGENLHQIRLGDDYERQYGAPYYHVHRADLHQILVKAFQSMSPDSIRLNATVSDYVEDSDGVTLHLGDGSSATGDVLIGADGLKSNVRDRLLGSTPCNWTGNVAWRGTIPVEKLPKNFMEKCVSLFVGPRKHMVIYYLRRQELVNFVGVVENDDWKEEGWTVKSPWSELKTDFDGWHDTVQRVIDAVDKDECYRWALFNRLPIDNWSSEHVTLLGDSAHATLPFLASGAAMAIEDARILSRSFERSGTIADCLRVYQRSRIARTRLVQETSTRMGNLYHQPDEAAFRDMFSRMALEQDRSWERWLAEYDANTVDLD